MKRRLLLAAAAAMAPPGAAPAGPARRLQVWRDPNCGCCGGWVAAGAGCATSAGVSILLTRPGMSSSEPFASASRGAISPATL